MTRTPYCFSSRISRCCGRKQFCANLNSTASILILSYLLDFTDAAGNPCIFPKSFFPALFSLEGDMGGNEVIKSNEDKLLFCDVDDERELIDVDVTETLRELTAHRKGEPIEIENDKIYREK